MLLPLQACLPQNWKWQWVGLACLMDKAVLMWTCVCVCLKPYACAEKYIKGNEWLIMWLWLYTRNDVIKACHQSNLSCKSPSSFIPGLSCDFCVVVYACGCVCLKWPLLLLYRYYHHHAHVLPGITLWVLAWYGNPNGDPMTCQTSISRVQGVSIYEFVCHSEQ